MPERELALEQAVYDRDDSIRGLPSGPERYDIASRLFGRESSLGLYNKLLWRAAGFPFMWAMIGDIKESFLSLTRNPTNPKRSARPRYWQQFEEYARSLNVGIIGFTKLPREAVFASKAVLYENVIVLIMEMDADRMDKAPSWTTQRMVMKTYYQLGRITTDLVDKLRLDGYAAQAGHPLNGLALYPLLAQQAGLGWCGSHGLLITPEFGPRHRIAAIYTNIQDLPLAEGNDHMWIEELCKRCGQCLRKCPSQAIFEEPVRHESGIVTHIDVDKCFPVFAAQHSCSLCIKVCPFNKHPYHRIKQAFLK